MMNKKVLTMAVMAAVCGMAVAPVWAANSGGTVNGDGKFEIGRALCRERV